VDYLTNPKVDITGVTTDSPIQDISIGGGTTAVDLPNGETVLIRVNEASILGANAVSLLSVTQMRDYNVLVDDKARRHGGNPRIMQDGVIIPLSQKSGLLQ
jgi:hypothetical protein